MAQQLLSTPLRLNQRTMSSIYGGGMIYGTKSDLPEELKELFTSNGYTVLALDYLLAQIQNRSHLRDANRNLPIAKRRDYSKPALWFVRAFAGGYLMLQLTKQLQTLNLTPQF